MWSQQNPLLSHIQAGNTLRRAHGRWLLHLVLLVVARADLNKVVSI